MTYWALNSIFLAAVALVAIVALAARRRPRWLAILIAAAILLIFTAVFDNIMIGIGLVGYDRQLISGVFIGKAPIEDFAYTIAAVVLLPSLWTLLQRRRPREVRSSEAQPSEAQPPESHQEESHCKESRSDA